jgi:hypothetical protein
MKKYLLLTVGYIPPTPGEMMLWNDWFASIKDITLDQGGFTVGKEVRENGTIDLPLDLEGVTGYLIIEAENLFEAEKIAARGPKITSTRVYELRTM